MRQELFDELKGTLRNRPLQTSVQQLSDFLIATGKVDECGRRLLTALNRYLGKEISGVELAGEPDMCDLSSDWDDLTVTMHVLDILIFPFMGGYCAEALAAPPEDKHWSAKYDPFGTKSDEYGNDLVRDAITYIQVQEGE